MKILVYGAFKNAEKSENYKEKVKKYLNNNEKNITYYIHRKKQQIRKNKVV